MARFDYRLNIYYSQGMRHFLSLFLLSFPVFALEVEGIKQTYQIELDKHFYGNEKLAITSHGYLNNCSYLENLHQNLIGHGYDVICINLPGHRPSSGKKFDIDRFETYANVLKAVLKTVQYERIDFIAHSTGTVGMTELLLQNYNLPIDKIILIAPLIRSYLYGLSYWSWRLGGRILPKLPRRPLGDSMPEYREIVANDPHYPRLVPSHFARQLFNWNARLNKQKRRSDRAVTVLFGTQDTVIETDYNRSFFQKYFSNAKLITISGSNHLFFYHNEDVREKFYTVLFRELED